MTETKPGFGPRPITWESMDHAKHFSFMAGDKTFVTFFPDGRIVLGEGAEPSDAAKLMFDILEPRLRAAFGLPSLPAEIARLRKHYQSNSALDHGRRNMLDYFEKWAAEQASSPGAWPAGARFQFRDRVRKKRGSQWQGRVNGFYVTEGTPIGYAVESEREIGSVQVWPEAALEPVPE